LQGEGDGAGDAFGGDLAVEREMGGGQMWRIERQEADAVGRGWSGEAEDLATRDAA
jgi:hypothetical protein